MIRRELALVLALSFLVAPALHAQTGPVGSGGGSTLATPVAIADGGTATTALTNGRIPYYDGTSLVDSRLRISGTALILDSGTLDLPAGAASAVTLRLGGDAFGAYRPSANVWAWSQNGDNTAFFALIYDSPMKIANRDSGQFIWSSTSSAVGACDTGLRRAGAAAVHASNCATGGAQLSPSATAATTSLVNSVLVGSVDFAALLAGHDEGTVVYCRDCTQANPCASGGIGAFAKKTRGAWICN